MDLIMNMILNVEFTDTLKLECDTCCLSRALDDYQSILFDKPYVRVPPYIVGMVTGYLVQRNPSTPTLTQKSKVCDAHPEMVHNI